MPYTIEMSHAVIVKALRAQCGVRYWEDATVNGKVDEEGDLIPLRNGDCWDVTIDLETGVIAGWPSGTEASVHYKVCDAGTYSLLGEDGAIVVEISDYVPSMLSPGGAGYGDYVIMEIDGAGKINNWRVDLALFSEE